MVLIADLKKRKFFTITIQGTYEEVERRCKELSARGWRPVTEITKMRPYESTFSKYFCKLQRIDREEDAR